MGLFTFEVIDFGFTFILKFLKLINNSFTFKCRFFANEDDLSELIIKMLRMKIHPSTVTELLLNSDINCIAMNITQDIQPTAAWGRAGVAGV